MEDRIKRHYFTAKNKNSPGYDNLICRAIRKYSEDDLSWEVIDHANTIDELNEREKYWISFYNSYGENGYNLTKGGEGVSGLVHSSYTREKISESERGTKNPNSKLTEGDVLNILNMANSNLYSQVYIAKIYNVAESTISKILSGYRWSSLTGIEYKRKNKTIIKNA